MLTPVMGTVHGARNAYAGRMPSYLHQLLLLLFRNRFSSAADLLRKLDDLLHHTRTKPTGLELEITENAITADASGHFGRFDTWTSLCR
jgi:EAL domain-containing protein (putative c-di-GMP-specific phosphodiesterase class I)